MSDEPNKPSPFPVSAVILILATMGLVVLSPQAFKGSRPVVQDKLAVEEVRVRLWQDPFEAIYESRRKASSAEPSQTPASVAAGTSRSNFRFCNLSSTTPETHSDGCPYVTVLKNSQDRSTTVLGILTPTGPYFEEAERRRRYRYAALSGLRRLGFAPEDAKHIRYMELKNGVALPYEFLMRKKEKEKILLLWIDEDRLGGKPLNQLQQLAKHLLPENNDRVQFRIMGPSNSETLSLMIREAKQNLKNKTTVESQQISLYACLARPDEETGSSPEDADGRESAEVVSAFKASGFNYVSLAGSEQKLAETILKELSRRRVDVRDPQTMIALVAEWDTSYGRTLPLIYRRALKTVTMNERRFITFSYLRGVDGVIPQEKQGTSSGQKASGSDVGNKEPARGDDLTARQFMERPDGNSQYDYIRRLAAEMHDMNMHLKSADGRSIRAIGILGSDSYDKYLMLQALRPQFPQAVFFTTDLDADMLSPDKTEVMRNLIVASNFNLSLRNDDEIALQGDVPPFRDSRQTSLFYGILTAFAKEGYLREGQVNTLKQIGSPRIFEIGASRIVDLSSENNTIHPVRWADEAGRKHFGIAIKIILLVGLLLWFSSGWLQKQLPPSSGINVTGMGGEASVAEVGGINTVSADYPKTEVVNAGKSFAEDVTQDQIPVIKRIQRWAPVALVIALLAGAVLFRFTVLNNSSEEPFSFTEGISIWPTEIIRLIAIILSFFLLLHATKQLEENRGKIQNIFFVKDEEYPDIGSDLQNLYKNDALAFLKRAAGEILNYADYNWWPSGSSRKSPPNVHEVWKEYVRRCRKQYMIPRLIVLISLYILLSALFIKLDPPISPLRGAFSAYIDMFALFGTVISFLILNFYVFDQTSMCRRFISLATDGTWNPKLVHWFCSGREDECDKKSTVAPSFDSPEAPLRDCMLIHLIAERTEVLGKMILYPMSVWILMFVARLHYFDNWHTPPGLGVVFSIGFLYTWSCAWLLRKGAEEARNKKLQGLRERLARASMNCSPVDMEVKRVEAAIREITAIRRGAFAPFTSHPLFQVLIPFGSGGFLYVYELFGKLNM